MRKEEKRGLEGEGKSEGTGDEGKTKRWLCVYVIKAKV